MVLRFVLELIVAALKLKKKMHLTFLILCVDPFDPFVSSTFGRKQKNCWNRAAQNKRIFQCPISARWKRIRIKGTSHGPFFSCCCCCFLVFFGGRELTSVTRVFFSGFNGLQSLLLQALQHGTVNVPCEGHLHTLFLDFTCKTTLLFCWRQLTDKSVDRISDMCELQCDSAHFPHSGSVA